MSIFSANIPCILTFKFEYVRCPSDKHDMQLVVDRNLNSCVIEEKANAIIARQGWLSLEALVHVSQIFGPT